MPKTIRIKRILNNEEVQKEAKETCPHGMSYFYYHVISVTNTIIAIYFGILEKARSNTMPKAILELEMPRNCKNCPLKYYLDYRERNYPWEDYVCTIIGKGIADKGRHPGCPLKLVEDKEVE